MIGRYFFFVVLLFVGSVFVLDFKTEMFEIPFLQAITYGILIFSIIYYLLFIQIPKWKYFKTYFSTVNSIGYKIYHFNKKTSNFIYLKGFLLILLFIFFSLFFLSLFEFDYFFFLTSLYILIDSTLYLFFVRNKIGYIITKKGIVTLNLSTEFFSFKLLNEVELRDEILYFIFLDGSVKKINLSFLNTSDISSFNNELNIFLEKNTVIRNQLFYKSL